MKRNSNIVHRLTFLSIVFLRPFLNYFIQSRQLFFGQKKTICLHFFFHYKPS